jgi:hypothetical protein
MKIQWVNGAVVFGRVMFGEVIHFIAFSQVPIDMILFLFDVIPNPIKCISIALDHFCLMVSVVIPVAVVLSVCRGEGGWGWLSSLRQICKGQASLAA